MEAKNELSKQFKQSQEKYRYYIIGLSVACIGYAIHRTSGLGIDWLQLPVGLAILFWGVSIFLGFLTIKYHLSIIYANHAMLKIKDGTMEEVGNHPSIIKAALSGVMSAIDQNNAKAHRYSGWQEVLFYLGMVSFIVWHVLVMAVN